MNIKKTLAAVAAAALAASVVSASASALDMAYYVKSDNNMIYVLGGSADEPSWSTDYAADPTTVYGVQYTVKNVEPGSDLSGKVIVNSTAGWNPVATWGSSGSEDIVVDKTQKTLTIKWCSDSAIFKDSDTWCQFALQSYSGPIQVTAIEILDASGNPINIEKPAAAEEEAAEEDAAAEAEAPAETEAAAEETEAAPEETEAAAEEEAAPAPAPAAALPEMSGDVLSEGEATSSNWGQAVKLVTLKNDDGVFDPSILTADKAVVVYYEADTAPEVILQSWSGGEGWAKVPANEDYSVDGMAVFTWDYMTAMYQSEDLIDTLDCFYVGDTGCDLTVTKVLLVDAASLEQGIEGDGDVIEDAPVEDVVEETEAAPVETEAPVVEAPAATPVANTGNTAAASIAAVMGLAGVVTLVSRKRK